MVQFDSGRWGLLIAVSWHPLLKTTVTSPVLPSGDPVLLLPAPQICTLGNWTTTVYHCLFLFFLQCKTTFNIISCRMTFQLSGGAAQGIISRALKWLKWLVIAVFVQLKFVITEWISTSIIFILLQIKAGQKYTCTAPVDLLTSLSGNRWLSEGSNTCRWTQLKFYWTLVKIINKWIHCHHVRNQWTKTMHYYVFVLMSSVYVLCNQPSFFCIHNYREKIHICNTWFKFRWHPYWMNKGTCMRPVWISYLVHDSEALYHINCMVCNFPLYFHRQPHIAAVYEDITL